MRPAKVLLLVDVLPLLAAAAAPGMTRVAPSSTMFELGRRLALAMAACDTPYLAAMPDSVSPRDDPVVRAVAAGWTPPPAPGTFSDAAGDDQVAVARAAG